MCFGRHLRRPAGGGRYLRRLRLRRHHRWTLRWLVVFASRGFEADWQESFFFFYFSINSNKVSCRVYKDDKLGVRGSGDNIHRSSCRIRSYHIWRLFHDIGDIAGTDLCDGTVSVVSEGRRLVLALE